MAEALGQAQVARLPGQRVQVRQHFAHAAVLRLEHLLEARLVDWPRGLVDPVGDPHQDRERLGILPEQECVAQPGHQLVQRVPGHANDGPAGQTIAQLRIAIGEAAYQAAMRRFLSGVELADDVVYPGAQPLPSGGRPRHRAGAQKMAQGVSWAKPLRLPSAVHRRLRFQSRIFPELVQQAVAVQ